MKVIKKTIEDEGFEAAAIIHSISDSSQSGGNIGWIEENSFSKIILENISQISGKFTNPISIPGGFIILKVNDFKNEKVDLNIQEETNRIINVKVNNQLVNFQTFT